MNHKAWWIITIYCLLWFNCCCYKNILGPQLKHFVLHFILRIHWILLLRSYRISSFHIVNKKWKYNTIFLLLFCKCQYCQCCQYWALSIFIEFYFVCLHKFKASIPTNENHKQVIIKFWHSDFLCYEISFNILCHFTRWRLGRAPWSISTVLYSSFHLPFAMGPFMYIPSLLFLRARSVHSGLAP